MPEAFESVYTITGKDFSNAGKVSTSIKETLKRLGLNPAVVRRIAIVSYEAEMNLVMYAVQGKIQLTVSPETVTINVRDEGPGIPDVDLAMQLEQDDDEMDLLHRTLFQHLLDDRWKHGIETAVDVTLLGRYYERYADHAVAVAKRVVFLVTGEHADDLQGDIQPEIQPVAGPEGA